MDVRGPMDLLLNYRNYKVIDGGEASIDGIKCHSITFGQNNLKKAKLFFSKQSKELISASVSFQIGMDYVTVSYKYNSIALPDQGSFFVGYPTFITSKKVVDDMRFVVRSFKIIENADEGILKIE